MSRARLVTLGAFALTVLIGGGNFVAIRFSNRELAPFWGAGIRFVVATAILGVAVLVTRTPLPRGRSLLASVAFGILALAAGYAFLYMALQTLSSAVAAVVVACLPLLTFLFALLHGTEPFRLRVLAGGLLALGGIVFIAGGSSSGVSATGVVLAFAGACCGAEAGVVATYIDAHPLASNTVAMATACVLLLGLSFVTGESRAFPTHAATWWSFAYLVVAGSCGFFVLALFVLQHWTASASAYGAVLWPPVAALLGAALLGERLTSGLAVGGVLVAVGVYFGALRTPVHSASVEPPA